MKDNLRTSIKVKKVLKWLAVPVLLAGIIGTGIFEGIDVFSNIPNSYRDYKTVNPASIEPVKLIIRKVKKRKEPIDYSKLTIDETIEHVQTPEQDQDYLDRHYLKEVDEMDNQGESAKENHLDRNGVCIDRAVSSAANLSDNGYPPYILYLTDEKIAHALHLYKTNKGFGTLGGGYMPARYKTIDDLIKDYNKKYHYHDKEGNKKKLNYSLYYVVNLDELYPNKEWIYGDKPEIFQRATISSQEVIHVK